MNTPSLPSAERLQRLLAPEPAALFRLLQRPPAWMAEDDAQELRDASILMLHDAKTPVARSYFEELLEDVFAELASSFIE